MIELPDALVLGAGGTLGEAWLRGVLNGLEAGAKLDLRECEYLLGTSAGSIVAASLAAGKRPDAGDAAAREWARNVPEVPDEEAEQALWAPLGRAARTVATPLASVALNVTAPAGRIARAAVLRRAPRPKRTLGMVSEYIDSLGASFDGRLRIAAVDRGNGRRVMFGSPDAPTASVARAVLASCAIPWVFAPVQIGEREYVDGGVWSPTNLDAVPAGRGSRVLALVPTAGAALASLRAATTAATAYESAALRARGVELTTITPDAASLKAIGANLMDASRRDAVAAAAYTQGRRLTASA